jgi:hypothetical protein
MSHSISPNYISRIIVGQIYNEDPEYVKIKIHIILSTHKSFLLIYHYDVYGCYFEKTTFLDNSFIQIENENIIDDIICPENLLEFNISYLNKNVIGNYYISYYFKYLEYIFIEYNTHIGYLNIDLDNIKEIVSPL